MTPMFVLLCVRAQACHRKCQHNFGSLESAPDAYLGCVCMVLSFHLYSLVELGLQAGTITCCYLLSHHRLLGCSMTPSTLLEIVSHYVALVGLELAM